MDEYLEQVPQGGWPNWVLGNHDNSRVATRLGSEDAARLATTLLLTLPGTPTVYYGDELSMKDVPVPDDEARTEDKSSVVTEKTTCLSFSELLLASALHRCLPPLVCVLLQCGDACFESAT